MSPRSDHIVIFEAGAIVFLSVGIFILDLLTPLGWAVWLLYFIPLVLTLHSPRERDPYYFAAAVTLLTIVGGFVSREGIDPHEAFFNRGLGMIVMWAFTWVMVSRKKVQERLAGVQVSRQQTEIAREEAVEARSQAETSLLGALDRERHATEETALAEAARQRAETKVLASKLRLEGVIQSAMDAIITVDDEQLIVLFNRAAEDMFECKADDMLGRPLDRLIPERFRQVHRDHIKRFGQSGVTTRQMGALGMITGLRAGGEEFPIEAAISQIAVDGKRYYTVILRDITERQRLEKDLAERESLLRTIIETEPECVKVLNLDGTVRSINLAGLAMVEAGRVDEIVGKEVCQLVTPEFRRAFTEFTRNAGRGQVGILEFEMVGLKGSRRWLETHAVPLRDPGGAITGVLGVTRDITTRKAAELALSRSEARLQDILNSMDEVVWSCSVDLSELFYVSPAIKKIYGRPAADFLSRPSLWLEMIHPEDRLLAELAVQELQEGAPFEVEYRIVRPDGGIRWIRGRGRVIKDDQGRPLRIDGVATDVTEKRSAERALKEAQERFEDIFEASKDAIGYASLDGTLVLANQAFANLTGYSKQELLTRTYRDLTPPEHRELQAEVVASVLQTGEPREYEKEYLRKDGSRIPVHVTVFAVKGDDGRPAGVAAIVRDITERKQAERLMRQSEERYRRLITVSPYAIFVNRGGRVIFANDRAVKLFGAVKADDIIGRSPLELFHPDFHEVIRERIHELIEGLQEVPAMEEKIVRLDGTVVDVDVSASQFTDEEGPAILVMLRDISERKRLQEQLRKTERIAELGALASGMAHEIGTPMNVILGRAEYLMQRVKEEPIKRGLQTIVTQVERITKVMNQLLSFARRRTPERRALDLRRTIEDNLDIFQDRLARNRVKVETSFPEACPMVLADPDQMSQVLINLVMNAIHAMPDGGTLRLALTPANDMVKLIVTDTGHGIPQEVIMKIFDPFFTTKEFGKGTGLGLTVVKGIIEEHNGTITVDSEPDKGTTFTIGLPIHKSL